MTARLYYEDCYIRRFDASLVERREIGGRVALLVDRTAFYPTSGGQPHDTGSLGGARVLKVEEDDSGDILHFLEAEPGAARLEGHVDWDRRFDHMQQHTGQHILSQAFLQSAGARTLSFHLGEATSTIDLDLPAPTVDILRSAEDLANRIVFESRPVAIRAVDRAELAALEVRKETEREGPIRVVEVEGFDRSPCGGTHVRRTSEVGTIAVLGSERYKGGSRIEFACGWRALRTLRREHEALWEAGRVSSSHPYELPQLVQRLIDERAALSRENSRLKENLLEIEAAGLVEAAGAESGFAVVRQVFTGRSMESLKFLAQKIAAQGRAVAVLGLSQETAQVVVARSPELAGHCGLAVQAAAKRLGGRGGGRPELAQAGGIPLQALEEWMDQLAAAFTAG